MGAKETHGDSIRGPTKPPSILAHTLYLLLQRVSVGCYTTTYTPLRGPVRTWGCISLLNLPDGMT